MRPPARPPNEAERLAELYDYGILDTPSERVFDEIAALAATICGTPLAAVSLIDGDRQWFKAAYGWRFGPTMPRDQSVCGHAILEHELFTVADVAADERFTDNWLLAGPPQVRFYGGSQLSTSRGNNIGMLCVLDFRPRELDALQRAALKQLADVVMAVLEAGRKSRLLSWFGSLLDRVSEEIYILDPGSLRFLYANAAATRILCRSLDELRALTPMELRLGPDRALLEGYVRELQAGAPQVIFESMRAGPDGETYPVEVRWQLQATRGQPVILSLVQDIRQRKAVERMKDEFISVVNHELRTPLTSIHGAVKLLERGAAGPLPEAATRLVELAALNTDRLRHIVDDILDLEKIASGRMEFDIAPLEPDSVLQRVLQSCELAAQAADVRLEVLPVSGPRLRADPERLHQVLSNLVSNAIKYAPARSVVTLAAQRAATGGVRLEVIDHGPGVPQEFRALIFHRFAQAEMNASRVKGGSGLGLSIAKEMTEQMGGSIGYDSQPGHTCFHVTFPEAAS